MMNRKNSLMLLTALSLAAVILAACAPKPAPVAEPVAVATAIVPAAALVADFPNGKFMAAHDPTAGYIFADGSWTYIYAGPAGETVSAVGYYTIQGNQWIETGSDPSKVCPFPATYAWAFDGTKLSFTLVGEDECTPRKQLTDGRTFVLAP